MTFFQIYFGNRWADIPLALLAARIDIMITRRLWLCALIEKALDRVKGKFVACLEIYAE
jgi:hypothetical protein